MKFNKRIVILIVGVIVLGAALVSARLRGPSQESTQKPKAEEPTRIHDGQMTEKQKEHSKLFKHSGRKLSDIATTQTGDVEVEEEQGYAMRLPETQPRAPVFASAVCNADAVVIGSIDSKSSQLTEEGNFVFTDYQVTLEEVIKDNSSAPLRIADKITTTRDGGVVEMNNRIFRAKRSDFEPPLVAQRYLLFLRFIPATGAYLMYGNGTFQLDDHKVLALSSGARQELLKDGAKDESAFLSELRVFAMSDCKLKSKGIFSLDLGLTEFL